MVFELIGLFVGLLLTTLISANVAGYLGASDAQQVGFESTGALLFGLAMVYLSVIQLPTAFLYSGVFFAIGGLSVLNKYRQRRKAMSGGYGEETKWASELIQEEDDEFILAVNALGQNEMMEIGIVAESKEELRELTIERFEEQENEQIPADFA